MASQYLPLNENFTSTSFWSWIKLIQNGNPNESWHGGQASVFVQKCPISTVGARCQLHGVASRPTSEA